MAKKGVSQLDWVMSLALFLLYLAWFFTFIMPNFNFIKYKNTAISLLKENFQNEFLLEKKSIPLFVRANHTYINKPIIANFSQDEPYYLEQDYYLINDKLIFLANISEIEVFWLNDGEKNTTNYYPILIEEDRASTENLSVYFEYSMPKNARYISSEKIKNISYKINDISLSPVNYTFIKTSFAGIYKATTENINITNIIFAYNPEIYTFFDIKTDHDYVFEIYLDLVDYDYYYSNNIYYGNFTSTEKKTDSYESDYVKIYSDDDAISLFFEDNAEFNFTYYNSTLLLHVKTKTSPYKIVFHTGTAEKQDYTYDYGFIEIKKGILLNEANYTSLKQKWNIPYFYISVYNKTPESLIFEIGEKNPKARNIYSETDQILIWQNDRLIPAFVNYRIWQ